MLAFDHVVVGALDVVRTTAFLRTLGLVDLGASTEAGVFVGVPGHHGAVRVQAAPEGPSTRPPYITGGQALDLYTRDLTRSLEVVDAAGLERGPAVTYAFGPMTLGQVQVQGPDGLPIVLVEIAHRLPSVLDQDDGRLHSQLHSVVWSVEDLDAATQFFGGPAGLEVRATFPLDAPEVSRFMQLPRRTPLQMSVLANRAARPPRFELLAYDAAVVPPEERGRCPGHPLTAGAILPVFVTPDLDSAEALLPGRRAADALGARLDATAPGGVDVEVREQPPENVGPFYARVP